MDSLTYVTTEECHFCEHGRDVLDQLGIVRDEVTVDSAEAEQLAAAGTPLGLLPVLTDGRRVIAYGRFSEKRMRKELAV